MAQPAMKLTDDVEIHISGRHMEIGDAFRGQIEERLGEIMQKHFDGRGWSAHVAVAKNSKRFDCECTVHLDQGAVLNAEGQAHDPVPAFEEAAERVEKRLRRHRRRLKEHRRRGGPGPEAIEMAFRVLTSPAQDDEEVAEDFSPTVVAESAKSVSKMSVADAVLALDMSDQPVLVFRNSKDDRVNLVYRRADGNVGWIDAAS